MMDDSIRIEWRFFNMDAGARCSCAELNEYAAQYPRDKGSWQAKKVPRATRGLIMLYAYGVERPYDIEDVIALDKRLNQDPSPQI
jgi:hypothetical protein